MELVGRLTANAMVKEISEGRTVVNFTIAINDGYKKDGEWIDKVTYVDCDYWLSPKIAEFLVKGRQVELSGQIGVNAYINASNNAVGKITLHVFRIKLGDKPREKAPISDANTEAAHSEAVKTDLPF
jgi:single-strand DNA-binding protein